MKHNEKINYWLDISQYDLETAEVMLEGRKFLYVGFMCHQAIEKILKGYYLFVHVENPPYTHNLSYLAKQCGIYEEFSEEQGNLIDMLEPLNVEARYPTHKEKLLKTLNYERCREIINGTKELYQWIKGKLSRK
jgi:HEPN domain-containing protein